MARVASVCGLALASSLRWAAAYHCESDIELGPLTSGAGKGLVLEGRSLRSCPHLTPRLWPNTEDPVKSLRVLKAWDADWLETEREDSWKALRDFALEQGARILVGTQISCDVASDEQDWAWALQFIQLLGPNRVMGVAIGDEVDRLWTQVGAASGSVTEDCVKELWEGGRFWNEFDRRVSDLNASGFGETPVTSVFADTALKGGGTSPFMEVPGRALVNSFLTNATAGFASGNPYAFTFNIHPYLDVDFLPDTGLGDTCATALSLATCFNSTDCEVPATVAKVRAKVEELTSESGHQVWIGEVGWSSPRAASLRTLLMNCQAWSSIESLQTFYSGFLHWDLEVSSGFFSGGTSASVPDHVFYFTTRDGIDSSGDFFGLISSCASMKCKIGTRNFTDPRAHIFEKAPEYWMSWLWLLFGVMGLVFCLLATTFVGNWSVEGERGRHRHHGVDAAHPQVNASGLPPCPITGAV